MFVGIAIAIAALVVVGLLVRFIAKSGGRLTAVWSVLLVLAVGIAMQLWGIAGIYFHMPLGWIVVLACAVLVMVALFVLAGKSVSWQARPVAAIVGLLLSGVVLMTIAAIALPLGALFTPVFEIRGQQIASDAGFSVLYPAGYELKLDYLPIDKIGRDSVEGVSMQYHGFELQERKADGELSMAELRAILAGGKDPLGFDMVITSSATYKELEVDGQPALGVEFTLNAEGKAASSSDLPAKQSTIRILAFGKDGVDVRIKSEGNMEYQGGSGKNERYEYVGPLSFDELAKVGGSLAPLK